MSDLDRLADLVGIEPFYHDVWGNRRDTSRETKCSLIAAMGLPTGSDAEVAQSLRLVEERVWRRMLPPVLVADRAAVPVVPVSAPAGLEDATLSWTLAEEDGPVHRGTVRFGDLPVAGTRTLDGMAFQQRSLRVETPAPMGYHRLEVDIRPPAVGGALKGESRLILAPDRCLTPEEAVPGGRLWGVGLQLYALRSGDDWGIGDFDDLGRFAEVAAGLGAGLVGLNPLHALFPADPNHFSPYSPSSRRFLNVFYIDVEAVPDLEECPEARVLIASDSFRADLAAARSTELVDYPAVARLKLPVLERLYAAFRARHLAPGGDSGRGAAFRDFQRAFGRPLRLHATFEALHERFYGEDPQRWSWQTWPEPYRNAAGDAVDAYARDNLERVEFFEYLQWEADRQLGEAAARAKRVGLGLGFYRDLAVAVNPGGAAAWADPDTLVQGASVGAPPDAFNMKGQNWGLAPLSPVGLYEAAYEPFIAAVRANMRHAGALRIDHVMALQHLFWIPSDGGDGAYVAYPLNDLLRIIALESRRRGCVVIGEDLGTVPEGFRPAMERAGILSYRVLYFERTDDGGFIRSDAFPERAMVTITTHDLPTLKGYWTGRDMEWRRSLDLYPDAKAAEKDAWDRGVDRWRLLQALTREDLRPAVYPTEEGNQPFTPELAEAVHRHLGRTPGQIVMMQIEDALGESEQPNLPGTIDQHPNWRRRLPVPLEAMAGHDGVKAVAAAIAAGREGR
ncbi:4-alpha-glucanotransferase [Azospirillum halopraeferens]|uniref:4-alpha-glucanotransferase n=1 Tax=Azospirillum halopraeferens TaxID=34010 RepID=UPI0003FE8EC1|nr:4-alpha-glucanotransferase [Azospirillum halopraeferens]